MSVCVERQIQEASEKSLGKRENFLCIGESMSEKNKHGWRLAQYR